MGFFEKVGGKYFAVGAVIMTADAIKRFGKDGYALASDVMHDTFYAKNHNVFNISRNDKFAEMVIFQYIDESDKYHAKKIIDGENYSFENGYYYVYNTHKNSYIYIFVETRDIKIEIDCSVIGIPKHKTNVIKFLQSDLMQNTYIIGTMNNFGWSYKVRQEDELEDTNDPRWPKQHEVIEQLREFFEGTKRNMGLILYGESQLGKTATARYAARILQKNYYRLNPTQFNYHFINDKLIGDIRSESIVFIDEFDKLDDKSKQSLNVELHRWLQSNDLLNHKVVFILTANVLPEGENNVLFRNRITPIKYE